MSERILIVGAGPSLGAALAQALGNAGHRVVPADGEVLVLNSRDPLPDMDTFYLSDSNAQPWYRRFDARGRKRKY